MYIVINKSTKVSAIFKEKKALSEYIECSVGTITNKNRFKNWSWGEFEVFIPYKVAIKSSRGGKRTPKCNF